MKKTMGLILVAAFLLSLSGVASALETKFTVSATVPNATGVSITPSSVDAASGEFTKLTTTALSFDPLIYKPTLGVWLPDVYFAIDVGTTGGGGGTDVKVNYTEGANPNAPGHGLGWKSTATFMKVVGTTETQISGHPKKKLIDVVNENILPAEIAGGYLRMYLGIVSKDKNATIPDPSDSEPFTNVDKPGTYDGEFKVTATLQ